MVDSVIPTVEPATDMSPESRRKRRRKSEEETQRSTGQQQARCGAKRWRTEREQQIYSSKLFEAIRRARRRSDEAGKSSGRVREIRDAADRTLAASARGTTRWSRAILASRARARLRKHKKAKMTGNGRSKRFPATVAVAQRPTRTRSSTVERKLKILGRLVPGCRKVSVPNLLEETSDYIAALEMQIRSMTALAELLATASPPPPATGA